MKYRLIEAHDSKGWFPRGVAVSVAGGVQIHVPGNRKPTVVRGRKLAELKADDLPSSDLRLTEVREGPAEAADDPFVLLDKRAMTRTA